MSSNPTDSADGDLSLIERDLRTIATALVGAAQDAGATHVEVEVRSTTRRAYEQGQRGRGRSAPAERVWCSVRVRDRRQATGLWQGEPRVSDTAAHLAGQALAAAAATPPDPADVRAGRLDVPDRGLGILDIRQEGITEADRAEVLEMNVEGVEGLAPGIVPVGFSYVEDRIERVFATSTGQLSTELSSRFLLRGTLRDEQADGAELVDSIQSRHFADVASVPLGVDMARRLEGFRTPADLPTGTTTLVIDQIAVARLLTALAPAFSAIAIESGQSFVAGRLGERIGSTKLHVIDDPGLSGALHTRSFDERGVPPMAIPLLREGVVGGAYVGPAMAAARGQRPTGHSRADGSLWIGNIIQRAGTRSRNMLLPEKGVLVAVEDILDTSGIDIVAGTIDVPVRALSMDGPTVVGCAGERRLRCSIEELLLAVEDVCSDQIRIREADVSTWIVEGISLQ
ncbi:MAG: hypothetical protein H6742_00940 [Alphaproteobacteria bacterium]|nr:hypothetical protein [Alphaproteobacteria bacterium]